MSHSLYGAAAEAADLLIRLASSPFSSARVFDFLGKLFGRKILDCAKACAAAIDKDCMDAVDDAAIIGVRVAVDEAHIFFAV